MLRTHSNLGSRPGFARHDRIARHAQASTRLIRREPRPVLRHRSQRLPPWLLGPMRCCGSVRMRKLHFMCSAVQCTCMRPVVYRCINIHDLVPIDPSRSLAETTTGMAYSLTATAKRTTVIAQTRLHSCKA